MSDPATRPALLLAIDAGKTDTRVGLFEGGSPAAVSERVIGSGTRSLSDRPADRVPRALAAVDLPAGGIETAAAGIAPRGSTLAGAHLPAAGDYDSAFGELVWRRTG